MPQHRKAWYYFALSALSVITLGSLCYANSPAEDQWVSLFDGKSLKDGAIQGSGDASMLVNTKGPYKNFKYRAEVKINDKGNSGQYFRTTRKPGFTDGYEAQINATHGDPIKSGSIYTRVHVYKANHKPDEWFTQEVECRTGDYRGKQVTFIKVTVNGDTLFELNDFENQFKDGYFAFQQHDPGSKVSIRKVEVMPLP